MIKNVFEISVKMPNDQHLADFPFIPHVANTLDGL